MVFQTFATNPIERGMRIVAELKRDSVPQVVLNKLYKLTPMQSSFGVINLAIVNGQPRVLNLKQMLECFIEFRREVVKRRTEYELRKAKARAHILEGTSPKRSTHWTPLSR